MGKKSEIEKGLYMYRFCLYQENFSFRQEEETKQFCEKR